MPRNGSGTYTLPSGINPVVTQTLITSNWANTTMNDIASALSQSLAKDGQTVPTANLPMGGFRHTGASDPSAADQYATLSFVQKGSSNRLTNVSGSNQITANLPGGLLTFTPGQIVQLTPAVNNNIGGVSLAINGGLSNQVTAPNGNFNLPAGALAVGKPYLLMWTGAVWQIIVGIDETSFMQSSISGWDRPANGIYPDITLVNPNTVSVPGGTGRIIQPSTRDVTGVVEVSWATQNVVLTNVATQWETTLAVNSQGQIVQFVGNVNSAWARNNIILGVIGHISGSIVSITNKPVIYGDAAYLAYDLGVMFRNRLLSGGNMLANAGNPLHLNIKGGQLWSVGLNADQKDNPNIFTFPDQLDVTFFPVTAQNTVGAATQTVPVTNYDPAGTGVVTPIPGGGPTSVIHRFYLLAGQFVFVYGQTAYVDLDTAVANIALDDTNYVKPSKLTDASFIGYIVARKDAVNLGITAQARLISASQGGSGAGGGGGGGIPDAPLDGSTYARNNGTWVKAVDQVQAGANASVDSTNPNKPIVSVPSSNLVEGEGVTLSGVATNRILGAGNLTISGNAPNRNKAINGNFDIWQRGTTRALAGGSGYFADRFAPGGANGGQWSGSRQAFAPGQTDVPNDPKYFLRLVVQSANTASSAVNMNYPIEDVATFNGRSATLTFWAKADANRNLSFELYQAFGVGGSPIVFVAPVKVALTTTWQKFTATFAVPSILGKTVGANNCLNLGWWFDAGSDFNSRTNSLGNQSGTFDIAQVQIEPGVNATDFEVKPIGQTLIECQRYYEKSYNLETAPGTAASTPGQESHQISFFSAASSLDVSHSPRFKVTKRTTPTVLVYSPVTGAVGQSRDNTNTVDKATSVFAVGQGGFFAIWDTAATSSTSFSMQFHWVADAEF